MKRPPGSFDGELIAQSRLTVCWRDAFWICLGRPLIVEYRAECEPAPGDETHRFFNTLRAFAWTQPKESKP